MGTNLNGKSVQEQNSSKSKYFQNNNKNTIQQLLNGKDSFVKTGFSGSSKGTGNTANVTGGLRSFSQKPLKVNEDRYKMPNINSHMYNGSPQTKNNQQPNNKEIINMINQQGQKPISPLKQSGKYVLNGNLEKRPNPASLNNRNAFLQQLKKDDTSPKLRYKDPIKENQISQNNFNQNTNSPILNSLNTMQSSTSMNSNSNSPTSLLNLKETIKIQKNEPQKILSNDVNNRPQSKQKNSPDKYDAKDHTPPKKLAKRGTLAETQALADMFKDKFKNVEVGGPEDSNSNSEEENEEQSPKNKRKISENQNSLIMKEKEKEKEKERLKAKIQQEMESSTLNAALIKVSYAKSAAGANEDKTRKTNQDSYISKTNLLNMKNFSLFSVFDGHGKNIFIFRSTWTFHFRFHANELVQLLF